MKKTVILKIYRLLRKEYDKHNAPIVDLVKVRTDDVFKTLVATILSARTKDETTAAACGRLFKLVRKPPDLRALPLRRIERLIFPVGFYHTKARHLKLLPVEMDRLFAGRIPDTIEDLCRLPGVGRKTANLVLAVGFGKPAICVDVHVHRISNRLGLVRTATPLETEMRLRRVLPRPLWKNWNSCLVSFGQTVCKPIGPKCGECPISRYCPIGISCSADA